MFREGKFIHLYPMGKKLIFCISGLWLATLILAAQPEVRTGISEGELTVGNMQRSFLVYVPQSYNASVKCPVIFLFHGGGGTPRSILNISYRGDFRDISERENILLVAPEGYEKSWNDGRGTKADLANVDDVAFVRELLGYLSTHYAADPSRFYAAGISNGGFMVSLLGCEARNQFAAIAVVAATMGTGTFSDCKPGFALPVMYIHGTDDPLVPIDGGDKTIGADGPFVSHRQVIGKWVAIDGCNPRPVVTEMPNTAYDGTTITREVFKGVRNGSEVVSYVIQNGGHTWPGGKQYLPRAIIGRVSRDMNGCEVMWEFFRRYKR